MDTTSSLHFTESPHPTLVTEPHPLLSRKRSLSATDEEASSTKKPSLSPTTNDGQTSWVSKIFSPKKQH